MNTIATVVRTSYGLSRRYVVNPEQATAWATITGGRSTIRDVDLPALAALGVTVTEQESA